MDSSHTNSNPSTINNNIPVRTSGPLSRTWPQLFKKRRRTSPSRDVTPFEQQLQQTWDPANTLPPLKVALSRSPAATTVLSDAVSITPSTSTATSHTTTNSTSTGLTSLTSLSSSTTHSSSTTSSSLSPATRTELLASKSNYEWIASGRSSEMGLHFSTAMATGVMMRRATHRAAEQARRDRMKSAMVDLAEYVLGGSVEFGGGNTCFVISRADSENRIEEEDEREGEADEKAAGGGKARGRQKGGKKGTNINKARVIEMALERLKRQERELNLLEERIRGCQLCRSGDDGNRGEVTTMDTSA